MLSRRQILKPLISQALDGVLGWIGSSSHFAARVAFERFSPV